MEDLLFLVHRMPYPPNKGDKVRSYHLLRYLATQYRVHLGTFIDDAADWQHVPTVQAWCGETHFARLNPRLARLRSLRGLLEGKALALPYYKDAGLARWVNDLCKRLKIKRVVVFSSPMAQYVNHRPELECVVDFVDVDSAKWKQYADADQRWYRAPLRWLYRREAQQLLAFERETAARANNSAFVTEAEAGLFKRLAPESAHKVIAVENGVDTIYFSPSRNFPSPYTGTDPVIVFSGAMDYWPNVDAVTWFAQEILPKVRESHANARFCIVGARPTPEVLALGRMEGISVTGTVPDVRPYLAHAAVAVVPMRVARGIQNKALEAMAMAKPVVITQTSAVALNAMPGEEFSVAEDAIGLARAVIALLDHPEVAEHMSAAARDCVVRNYSWMRNLVCIDAVFRDSLIREAATISRMDFPPLRLVPNTHARTEPMTSSASSS